jgi:heme/copper-type cytochrome/quinol oxidase subunit 2
VNWSTPGKPPRHRRFLVSLFAAILSVLSGAAPSARASAPAPVLAESNGWWLPPNYSVHGEAMDMLFYWIFWITMVIWAAVWIVMAVFLVKYRYRPERKKALFTHGNTRLEMIWTLAPAVILILLALLTKRVWDEYRFPSKETRDRSHDMMVIAEQFNWNVVYPGPDGKLGRYLIFPKTTDLRWPTLPEGDSYVWPEGVPGPAFMPTKDAATKLKEFIDAKNRLGKDFTDPAGKDDDWQQALGRPVYVPRSEPVRIILGSKDVLHDFFLPNHRVKLDAVPGLRGEIYFTATKGSAEYETASRKRVSLDDLRKLAVPGGPEYTLEIPPDDPRGEDVGAPGDPSSFRRYWQEVEVTERKRVGGRMTTVKTKKKETLASHGTQITAKLVDELKAAGFTEVQVYVPKYWDLVCEELCGIGHTKMQGKLVVLEPKDYERRFGRQTGPTPATQPVIASRE